MSSKPKRKLNISKPNSKYSIEHFSSDILTSDDINAYLADGTNLIKSQSLPGTTKKALSAYFTKILGNEVKCEIGIRSIQPLKDKGITIINDSSLTFFRSIENNKIILSRKKSTNLLDVLNFSMGGIVTADNTKSIIDQLLLKYPQTYIDSIINSQIPELNIPANPGHNYTIPREKYTFLIEFYNNLINIVAENLNINLIAYIPTKNITDSKLITFYISNFKDNLDTIGIKIIIPFLSKVPRNKVNKADINKIYYENLCELDSSNNTIVTKFSDTIIKKIKGELDLVSSSKQTLQQIGDEILFNPQDREGELKIIEVQISETIVRRFLLGKTGNLYEDDDELNDLVGKLIFINQATFSVEIFWCKDYLEKIIGTKK